MLHYLIKSSVINSKHFTVDSINYLGGELGIEFEIEFEVDEGNWIEFW